MENTIKKDYEYYRTLPPERYPEELALWYREKNHEELNLEHPTTYNEKIQWLKLYDATPEKARLADKYLVRDWVRERIGEEYLIPLLGVWDSFDEIDFDALPDSFVLKCNHGCGWNVIVQHKALLDREAAKYNFDHWMRTNFSLVSLELHYSLIRPKIIAEAYLENNSEELYDYKVFCFGGKAKYIMHLADRSSGLKMSFFDLNWNRLGITYNYPENEEEIPRPRNLDLLISLSERLAEGFPHVRVDFYILNDGSLKFGEMTFTSSSGYCIWNPPEQNRIMGDMLRLPGRVTPLPDKSFAQRGFPALPADFRKRETNYRRQAAWLRARVETVTGQRDEYLARIHKLNDSMNERAGQHRQTVEELRDKLRQAWAEKSEVNARLKQAWAEKSEVNAKLKQTYDEKFERGVEIKRLNKALSGAEEENRDLRAKLSAAEDENRDLRRQLQEQREKLSRLKESAAYKTGRAITQPGRAIKKLFGN